jgi:thiol:disulfide interchange protein DsbG
MTEPSHTPLPSATPPRSRATVVGIAAIAIAAGIVLGMVIPKLAPKTETPPAATGQLVPVPKDAKLVAGTDYPFALAKFIEKGGKLLGTINVGDGITGYLLEMEGQRSLVYGSPKGEVMIVGAVLDKAGESLTADHMKLAGLSEGATGQPAQAANTDVTDKWPEIQKAAFATTGAGTKTLYAFYEPHCGYCAHLVEAVASKGITMKWIPVGFLTEDSGIMNAGFVREKDGSKYLQEWMAANARRDTGKFLSRVGDISPAEKSSLKFNNDLMASLGIDGTPAILVRDATGKVEVVRGMPTEPQLDAIIARLPG